MNHEFVRPVSSQSVKLLTEKSYRDIELQQLDSATFGNLNIHINEKVYKIILFPSSTKKLYVFLSAAAAAPANSLPYPQFFRMTWSNFIDGMCLYIDDRNRQSTFNGPTFFLGHNGNDFFSYLSIIKQISLVYDIDNSEICFLSSSNGGYASVLLCNTIKGSRCISFNGQLSIPVFFDNSKLFESYFNLDRKNNLNLLSAYSIINNTKSKFFLFFNINSESDAKQLKIFCKNINYEFCPGLQRINNVILAVESIDSKSAHHAQPNEDSFLLYDEILQNIDQFNEYTYHYNANIKALSRYYSLDKLYSIEKNVSKFKDFCMKYATLRIDIKNKGIGNNFQILSINPLSKLFYPDWFSDNGVGAVIHSDNGSIKIIIKCIGNGLFSIFLRGVFLREKGSSVNKKIAINCTKFIVNSNVIFSDIHQIWHDEPFMFEKKVVDNEIISLSVEWQPLFFSC